MLSDNRFLCVLAMLTLELFLMETRYYCDVIAHFKLSLWTQIMCAFSVPTHSTIWALDHFLLS